MYSLHKKQQIDNNLKRKKIGTKKHSIQSSMLTKASKERVQEEIESTPQEVKACIIYIVLI